MPSFTASTGCVKIQWNLFLFTWFKTSLHDLINTFLLFCRSSSICASLNIRRFLMMRPSRILLCERSEPRLMLAGFNVLFAYGSGLLALYASGGGNMSLNMLSYWLNTPPLARNCSCFLSAASFFCLSTSSTLLFAIAISSNFFFNSCFANSFSLFFIAFRCFFLSANSSSVHSSSVLSPPANGISNTGVAIIDSTF